MRVVVNNDDDDDDNNNNNQISIHWSSNKFLDKKKLQEIQNM